MADRHVNQPNELSPSRGKIPPQAPDLEKRVIGILVLHGERYVRVAMRYLDQDDFYVPQHGRMFRAILELMTEKKPVDEVTVVEQLRRSRGSHPDDPLYMTECTMEGGGSQSNLEYYCRVLLEKSVLRKVIVRADELSMLAYGETESAHTMLAKVRQFTTDEDGRLTQTFTQHISHAKEELVTMLRDLRLGKSMTTKKFYIREIDEMTGGMMNGNFIVVAGPGKSGKTSLALQIVYQNARHGIVCQIFSQEMTKEECLLRMAILVCNISWLDAMQGKLASSQWDLLMQTIDELSQLPIYVNDRMNTLGIIETEAEAYVEMHGVGLVVVDYIQIIGVEGQFETREKEIAALSRGLKQLAKKLNLPIVALSQVNDDYRTRESKGIEHDLDKLLVIKREEKVEVSEVIPVDLKLMQRMGPSGGFGSITIGYRLNNGEFVSIAPQTLQQQQGEIF